MMQDLAMHLLELVMNAIEHGASHLKVHIFDSVLNNRIYFKVIDDGKGMDETSLKRIASPFYTSRNTRKVGLGVSFIKSLIDYTNGHFNAYSKVGIGTEIHFDVQKDHIDLPPLGDMGEVIMMCFNKDPNIKVLFEYKNDFDSFVFDLEAIEDQIGELDCLDPMIQLWIKDYINEGIKGI